MNKNKEGTDIDNERERGVGGVRAGEKGACSLLQQGIAERICLSLGRCPRGGHRQKSD